MIREIEFFFNSFYLSSYLRLFDFYFEFKNKTHLEWQDKINFHALQ